MRASIVIPVRDGLAVTGRCLESIAAHTSDVEIIVVDNGSGPEMREYLASRRETVIRNEHNLGWPIACNQGMARAQGDVVVLLNNDTEVSAGWLDLLLAPFADPAVGLVGPWSDNVSGPQGGHGGARREVRHVYTDRLVGFCLAIRRKVIAQIGGLDPIFGMGNFDDDDYCLRAQMAGWKLVIAERCWIHHVGGATFQIARIDYSAAYQVNLLKFGQKWASLGVAGATLADMARCSVDLDALVVKVPERAPRISLCMIVRDEAQYLAECLWSVAGAVDEICIVDTGSTDRTIEIAESFGARVERMEWRDDFAAARNRSLDMATGDRILVLDADERLLTSAAEVRWLSWLPLEFAAVVQIERSPVLRWLNGRAGIRYAGAVHEQPTLPGREVPSVDLCGIRLRHLGYEAEVIADRDKIARNLRLAEAMGSATFHGAFNLCRAHWDAQHYGDAELYGRLAMDLATTPSDEMHAGVMEIAAAGTRDADDALRLAEALAATYPDRPHLAFLVGKLLAQLGRHAEAMTALDWRTRPEQATYLRGNYAAPEMSTPGTRLREACAIYVDCARALSRMSDAVAYVAASIEITPTPDPALYELLASTLCELGEWQTAGEVLNRGLKVAPASLPAWRLMGQICTQIGREDLAEAAQRNIALLAS